MTITAKHGMELLHDPSLSKLSAFIEAEKHALGVDGLVPDTTKTDLDHYIRPDVLPMVLSHPVYQRERGGRPSKQSHLELG
jgi:hypothetical protein